MTDIGRETHNGELGTSHAAAAPPEVSRVAAAHGLGSVEDVRHGESTGRQVLIGWGIAAFCLVVGFVLFPVAHSGVRFAQIVYRPLFIAGFMGLIWGIRGLVVGRQSYYLYDGGILYHRRSVCRAIAWPNLARVAQVRMRGWDHKLGYRVDATDGTSITVPAATQAESRGRDTFADRLMAVARQNGRTAA